MQCQITNIKRPIQRRPVIYLRDIQQDMPAGWCTACGQELYVPDLELCRRCERKEEYDETTSKSLSNLYPGEKSR